MICKHCNKEIPDGSAFCPACGKKVDAASSSPENPKKKKGIIAAIAGAIVVACIIGGVYVNSTPEAKYKKADKAFTEGRYEAAIKYYDAAGDYMDSGEKKSVAEKANHWNKGKSLITEGKYDEAKAELISAKNYDNSAELIKECDYNIGLGLKENGSLVDAAKSFKAADGFNDSEEKILQIGQELLSQTKYQEAIQVLGYATNEESKTYLQYAKGMEALEKKNYQDATKLLYKAKGILDADEQYNKSAYDYATELLGKEKYKEARDQFRDIKTVKDSSKMIDICSLMMAKKDMNDGNLNTAKEALLKLPGDCAYQGVSASGLIEKLDANSQWMKICGRWTSTEGQMRVTQTGSYGYYHYWYYDFEEGDVNVDVRCKINDDGTVTVVTSGSLPFYTEYSPIAAGVKQSTQSLAANESMSEPGTITINDNTALTVSDSKITAAYNKKENNRDVYFTYTYKTNAICAKKIRDY